MHDKTFSTNFIDLVLLKSCLELALSFIVFGDAYISVTMETTIEKVIGSVSVEKVIGSVSLHHSFFQIR